MTPKSGSGPSPGTASPSWHPQGLGGDRILLLRELLGPFTSSCPFNSGNLGISASLENPLLRIRGSPPLPSALLGMEPLGGDSPEPQHFPCLSRSLGWCWQPHSAPCSHTAASGAFGSDLVLCVLQQLGAPSEPKSSQRKSSHSFDPSRSPSLAENYPVDQRVGLKTSSPGSLQVFTRISEQQNLLGKIPARLKGSGILVIPELSSSVQPDLAGAELGGKCWL